MPVVPTAPPVKPEQNMRLTDLSVIGVPADLQDQWPQVVAYPAKFSDEAFPVWHDMLADEHFKQRIQSLPNKDIAWHSVILEFLARCEAKDIPAVIGGAPTVNNAHVHTQMRYGRLWLVHYCNEIGLFNKIKVQYPHREYIRTPKGFIVYSWARCFPVKDPTLPDWLTSLPMPRFIKHNRQRMVATIRPGVRLWIDCINLSRVVIGQEIDIQGTIDIPGNPTPTRQDVDTFIEQTMWVPLARSVRFDGVENRLF